MAACGELYDFEHLIYGVSFSLTPLFSGWLSKC